LLLPQKKIAVPMSSKPPNPMSPDVLPVIGVTSSGAVRAGASEAIFQHLRVSNKSVATECPCAFHGTLAEFAAAKAAGNPAFESQLRNTVRKCTACGKPCAYTMKQCNNCEAPLPEEVVYTDNIFMAFVYGVEKGERFPYNIAVRKQTEELLVFDDPLALAACHFCSIPTSCWASDWRVLLRAPEEGLALITKLEDAAWSCCEQQFLTNEAWCTKHIRGGPPADAAARAALRSQIVCGCNFPPSQFQLHIQYFLMPWLPSHYGFFIDGAALVRKRWFPLAYIKEVLALKQPMEVTMETTLDEIFAVFDDKVSYNDAFDRELERVATAHAAMANWQPSDFAVAVVGDTVVEGTPPEGATPKQLIEADKKLLQSHGPVKTYYQFARAGGQPVPEFGRPQPAKL